MTSKRHQLLLSVVIGGQRVNSPSTFPRTITYPNLTQIYAFDSNNTGSYTIKTISLSNIQARR